MQCHKVLSIYFSSGLRGFQISDLHYCVVRWQFVWLYGVQHHHHHPGAWLPLPPALLPPCHRSLHDQAGDRGASRQERWHRGLKPRRAPPDASTYVDLLWETGETEDVRSARLTLCFSICTGWCWCKNITKLRLTQARPGLLTLFPGLIFILQLYLQHKPYVTVYLTDARTDCVCLARYYVQTNSNPVWPAQPEPRTAAPVADLAPVRRTAGVPSLRPYMWPS